MRCDIANKSSAPQNRWKFHLATKALITRFSQLSWLNDSAIISSLTLNRDQNRDWSDDFYLRWWGVSHIFQILFYISIFHEGVSFCTIVSSDIPQVSNIIFLSHRSCYVIPLERRHYGASILLMQTLIHEPDTLFRKVFFHSTTQEGKCSCPSFPYLLLLPAAVFN